MALYEEQIIECKSWLENGTGAHGAWRSGNRDVDGHGTHCASLLLKVAPHAALYVARVFQDRAQMGGENEAKHIAEAIIHAVRVWQVDIISLSFGFPDRVEVIHEALKMANNENVLVFAAASNCGSNDRISYPASSDKVICIHATDGLGNKASFTPGSLERHDNFAAPGVAVKSYWSQHFQRLGQDWNPERRLSGTSSAAPIAAGIAALVLEFVRSARASLGDADEDNLKSKTAQLFEQLKERQEMIRVLNLMVWPEQYQRYQYLTPWKLFDPGYDKTFLLKGIYYESRRV
ncbi:subtilisin-like protein [Parathielavia hyrcaniae]|uniref:Subtilisin-like protein n=1 Tax=Parathielavia hyrcaniae TaxID=113614 RepID=A0AAN6Q053_9PEZI|nr:subtilisin-like protein [Parathielavia hyrcaniae]